MYLYMENIDTKSESFKYQFTRHLASCNNINKGKTFGKDYEPSAALYGIINTAEFSQFPSNSYDYAYNHVYVSNLIRTWITAVLLYGTHDPEELNLYVSPFLKENHMVFLGKRNEIGNFPKEIYHSAKKFQKFLTTLYDFSNHLPEDYYSKLPKIINLILPVKKDGSKQMIVFEKQENGYKIQDENNVCSMEDNAGPKTKQEDGFIVVGDLHKFMEWFESGQNYHGTHYQQHPGENNEERLVHVVTHSHIMQQYLKDKFNFDIDKIKDYSNVRNSNTWRFKTRKEINDSELVNMIENEKETQKKVPLLIPGVLLNKPEAIKLENDLSGFSLCGTSGSIEPIICSKGGKYTKKNRKQTKKLKNRKNKTNRKNRK